MGRPSSIFANVRLAIVPLEGRNFDDAVQALGLRLPEGACSVGKLLSNTRGFDLGSSFLLVLVGVRKDGQEQALYWSGLYRIGGCAILTDTGAHEVARDHGFHLPFTSVRLMYAFLFEGLESADIVAMPSFDGSHTLKMKGLGFSEKCYCPTMLSASAHRVPTVAGLARMRDAAASIFLLSEIELNGAMVPFVNELGLFKTTFFEAWSRAPLLVG